MTKHFFKLLFTLIVSLASNPIAHAQLGIEWRIFAGANASIVIDNFYDRVAFFASPPRPYYSIHYMGGVEAIKPLNDWLDISAVLNYEKISSSILGFAKEKDYNYDFLAFSLSGKIRPIQKRSILLTFGLNQYLNINTGFANGPQKNWPLAVALGFECSLTDNFHLYLKTLQPLSYIEKGYDIITFQQSSKTNFHSFQLVIAYDIKLKK